MIEASAPVRICDLGGWTDTWFGGPGRVLNLAVRPGLAVSISRIARPGAVLLAADDTAGSYAVAPGASRVARHPLLEAAIDARPPPDDLGVAVRVRSAVPPGAGTGTSASVAVALLGALAAVRSEDSSPRDLAYAAHRLEVEALGRESGVQDQLSAALGGISYLEIDRYPDASVCSLPSWDALSAQLTLVFVGQAHDSSAVHAQVIEDLAGPGAEALARLRDAAEAARDAVRAQDLRLFGEAMIANTDAQAHLHPALVGPDARRVIEVAQQHGAAGWKVNGAGGDGGSVTVLSRSPAAKAEIDGAVAHLDARYRVLPVAVSRTGLEVVGAI